MRVVIGSLLGLVLIGTAQAQTPAFDPRTWKGEHAGPPTQILTLGSTHLGQEKVTITAQMLEPLLDKLAAFKPTIITQEGVSGEQCDLLLRFAPSYPGVGEAYCFDPAEVSKITGLTVPAAIAAVEQTLADWPAAPSAAQRRRLAMLFLSANDRPSAQVQWLRLPANERLDGDGITPELRKILTRAGAKPNERYDIAVALAVRVGLERVYAVDDQTAGMVEPLAGPDYGAAIQKIWARSESPSQTTSAQLSAALATGADVLNYYRFLNQPTTQLDFMRTDFGAAFKDETPQYFGRQYAAYNEIRNLRMVANIRVAIANHPGARVINIVGASHKGYYDAYLDMISDAKMVDAAEVLK